MTDSRTKRAVLAALSYQPDFSGLRTFPRASSRAGVDLQRWMDRGGVALTLLRRLQEHNVSITEDWREALNQRLAKNIERTKGMLAEAQRLHAAFRSFGVMAATLKGFTLTPDFCDDPYVRHQVDFDFLVAPDLVHAAAEALRFCGYSAAQVNEVGESCFLTPLQHIPSVNDDLYVPQPQRQVDLHISIWEPCPWLPVEVPRDCVEHALPHSIHGLECLSLSLEDKFLVQVLHAFRHSFRSWMRISWLLEIGRCMENHQGEDTLWRRVIHRAGSSRLNKSIFAFLLGLIDRLFHTPIPSTLRRWTENAMTVSLRAWLDEFGVNWAISDWPGSLNNLFLASEFVPDANLRKQYWRSRLLPRKEQTSLGAVCTANTYKLLQWQAARATYVAHRATAHLKDIIVLPWQQFRWKRALESSRRLTFHVTS
jgi:hypothetical protein